MKSSSFLLPFDRAVVLFGLLAIGAATFVIACTTGGAATPPAAAPMKTPITFVVPTPEPVEIFWLDTAGNLGLRGVDAVLPGPPASDAKVSDACRTSATKNGEGTLTICLNPAVGKALAEKLGWTSEPSAKR